MERTPRHEIVHKGQLQQKVLKKFGTLLRKKKNFYEDELWVVLCVHDGGNGGIPHLEWYGEPHSIFEHRPVKVQDSEILDLLDCQYVNVAIGEERCMVIGFVDRTRPILELSAPSIEERKQWVDTLTRTLRRLNCLIEDEQENEGAGASGPRAENEYIAFDEENVQTWPNPPPILPTTSQNWDEGAKESEEKASHVPLSQISGQMHNLSLSRTPPTTLNRALCLDDTIPMLQQPSSSAQPIYLAPVTTEDLPSEIDENNSSLPTSSSPANSELYTKPNLLARHNVPLMRSSALDPRNVKKSGNSEECIEDELVPPPLPPRQIKPSLSQNTPIPRMPTSPIPASPPQKLFQYDVLNSQLPSSSRSQYDQIWCPSNGHGRSRSQYQQISPRLSSEVSADHVSSTKSSSCSSSARNSDRRQSTEDPTQLSSPPTSNLAIPYNVHSSPSRPLHYDVLASPQLPPSTTTLVDSPEHIFRESLRRPRRISFWLTLLAEHVAFVELGEKVWVAGWSPKVDTNLRDILNFGDEVEYMNGIKLHNVHQLPEIYANIKPGVQIELSLRSNPTMKVFTMIKTSNPKRELGIMLHRGKNKIASIEPKSPADRSNLPSAMPAYFHHPTGTIKVGRPEGDDRSTQVRPVITQLNGIPLSPFARNDQFFQRLDKCPTGQPVHLTLHPADFCTQLARQLKTQLRDWRRFVHDV